MKVIYYVSTETANFCFYVGEHSETEIADMNFKISNFIMELTNATESG